MTWGFIFPGQGSQEVGMLAELAAQQPVLRACIAEAEETLGLPLGKLMSEGPESELNRTEITQPALLTASVALWRLWQSLTDVAPVLLAGHSLGEYSALVCAGVLEFSDAVVLVHQRGRLMQQAVPAGEGAMAAILGLDDDQIADCCAAVDGVVTPANFNAPGQTVIAGSNTAVDAAIARCQDAGARRALKLAVSVPSHCALMVPAAEKFAELLAATALNPCAIPVIQNVDACISDDVEGIRTRLIAQLSQPVRWTGCSEALARQGVTRLVECGPGKVLAGLQKRIDRSISVASLASPGGLASALEQAANG